MMLSAVIFMLLIAYLTVTHKYQNQNFIPLLSHLSIISICMTGVAGKKNLSIQQIMTRLLVYTFVLAIVMVAVYYFVEKYLLLDENDNILYFLMIYAWAGGIASIFINGCFDHKDKKKKLAKEAEEKKKEFEKLYVEEAEGRRKMIHLLNVCLIHGYVHFWKDQFKGYEKNLHWILRRDYAELKPLHNGTWLLQMRPPHYRELYSKLDKEDFADDGGIIVAQDSCESVEYISQKIFKQIK